MKISRMVWLAAGATLWLGMLAKAATTSQWVYPGPDGKLVYKTTPAGDRIMDFSYAGYMGGGVALPDVPAMTQPFVIPSFVPPRSLNL